MIEHIDTYFEKGCGRCERFATTDCSTRRWLDGLLELRRICLGTGLEEALKWAHPCYVHAGRNVAVVGAFRNDFRLSFFHAALMQDPDGVLEPAGPNTRHAGTIRFLRNEQVSAMEPILRRYLAEAMAYAEAGTLPPKEDHELELPDELIEALDADPELAEAFHALTPGRRKSYVIHLSSAKKPETRFARIERARDGILAGKGFHER